MLQLSVKSPLVEVEEVIGLVWNGFFRCKLKYQPEFKTPNDEYQPKLISL